MTLKRSKKPEYDKLALKTSKAASIEDLGHEASVLLDRVLANDTNGHYEVYAPLIEKIGKRTITRATPKKTIYVSNEIDRLVETAVRLHRALWPRASTTTHPKLSWWLARGVLIDSERFTLRKDNTAPKVTGENNYRCLFCRADLATFGWDDGVRRFPSETAAKLVRHTYECGLRMLMMYADEPDEFPSTARYLEVPLYRLHSQHAQLVEVSNEEERMENQ